MSTEARKQQAVRALERLGIFFQSAFDKSQDFPKTTLAVLSAIFVLAIFGLSHLRFELTVFEIRDPGFPSARDLREMREEWEDSPKLNLFFFRKDGQNPSGPELCSIQDWIDNQARRDDVNVDTFSPFQLREPRYDAKAQRLTYPLLLPNTCDEAMAKHLSDLRLTPWQRLIVNTEGGDLTAGLALSESNASDRYTGLDPHVTQKILDSLKHDLIDRNPQLESRALGGAATELQIHDIMKKDSVFQLAILLALMAFFRIFYGTWKLGFVLVLSLLFTITATYATLAFLNWPFDVLSNNLFIMLCVSGVEDFLFVCYLESRKSGQTDLSPRDRFLASFRAMILPGFFTSFTTILGFLSLYSSKFGLIGRFGLMSAWAAFLEWGATFFLIPVIIRLLPAGWIWIKGRAASVIKLDDFRRPTFRRTRDKPKRVRTVLVVASLLFVAGVVSFFHLNFEDAFAHAFPASHPHSQALKYLKKTRGWEDTFDVIFSRDSDDAEIRRAVAMFEKQPNVVLVDHIGRQVDHLTRNLATDLKQLVAREITASDLYKRYVSHHGNQRIQIYVADSNGNAMGPLLDRIQSYCGERCNAVGEAVVLEAYSRGIAKTLTESFVWSVLLVSCVMLFLCWALGFHHGFRVVACSIWTPVVMVAVMAVFQVRIDFITSMFLANIVGLSGDNVIQFLFNARQESGPRTGDLREGLERMAGATRQMAILLATCCAGFVFMTLIPVRVLGVLLAAGFLVTWIGDVYLLRAALPEAES